MKLINKYIKYGYKSKDIKLLDEYKNNNIFAILLVYELERYEKSELRTKKIKKIFK